MYNKRRLSVCEICGKKTHYLGYVSGKHVCGECEYLIEKYGYLGKNVKGKSLF
ncbi:MAG: hypothetical protein ACFFDF_17165 [Candidatus Odinarchaeota archaeon]